ncbi:MAG: hypothetical protein V1743_07780 [Nanoarchaeota archaeon]
MAWNYTPFHNGSSAVIKYNYDRNEVVVRVGRWNGYSGRPVWVGSVGDNNSNANDNNNLNNNNARLVGIGKPNAGTHFFRLIPYRI